MPIDLGDVKAAHDRSVTLAAQAPIESLVGGHGRELVFDKLGDQRRRVDRLVISVRHHLRIDKQGPYARGICRR